MKTLLNSILFILFLAPTLMWAQTTVTGTVTEQASELPLPGVNVLVKGTSSGTVTDFDGQYQLSANNGDVIVFSYVGYKTLEITYSGQSPLNVQLAEDTAALDEIVIVGYGSMKKKDLTGSIDVISDEDFNKGPVVSADQLITGKLPGVRITSNGGQPDAAPNIRIRGGSSLNANNSPLIVIDGVPLNTENPAGVSNPFNMINPNDIESVTVLKDASASAIYGNRASNGVIIITTKSGTSGEIKFNFSANATVSEVSQKIDMMTSDEFVRFIQEYHPNFTNYLGVEDGSGLTDDLSTPQIEGRTIYDSDWQDAIYRTAFSSNYDFSARGSIANTTPFRASVGYNNTEGIVKTSDYERITASIKLTPSLLDDHLRIDLNAKGLYSNKNAIDEEGALGGAISMDPTKPIYDNSPDNRFGKYYQNTTVDGNRLILDGASNPLALLEQRKRPEELLRFIGNVKFDYKMHFLPELSAILNLGTESSRAWIKETYSDNSIATYKFDANNDDINTNYVFNPGENYFEEQHVTNVTMDAFLRYAKDYEGFLRRFEVQGGYTYQNFKNDGNKREYEYDLESGLRQTKIDPYNLNNRYYDVLNLQAFLGRSIIDFDNKYLLTVSARYDGSSLFTKDNRWGFFPAGALAWRVSNESFLMDSSFVNDLKFRIGIGKTGQQDIVSLYGNYPSRPLFIPGDPNSNYLPGLPIYSAEPYNPDLTWEKTVTYNLGVDFNIFKNGIASGSFDVYRKFTKDLLSEVNVPPGQGLSDRFLKNIGETKAEGFEATLNLNLVQKDQVNFSVNGNLGYTKAEVVNIGQSQVVDDESDLPLGTGVYGAVNAEGEEPYSAWVFKQVYDTDGNPIQDAFVDLNGDNRITNADRYYTPLRPNWIYGFGFNFTYKNWDLTSSFRGQLDGQVYNTRRIASGSIDQALPNNNNSLTNVLNFYDGTANPSIQEVQGNMIYSDYYLESAAFLRCENIVLGVNIPDFTKGASLRLYGSVTNAFLIDNYSGQDPENFNAIDNNFYPRPRIYSFGINLDF
ncbi:SusC/RagA family TonB-linked outer membrane protein [Mangrovimonas aestuarii]|uniref:SusC/RagA family TonB-linked outer membrane protein n=1 Tax=Mangrovimonas aestuarii TaxID=3018443 RepID=UPI002377E1AC|nr:SusC/RagA family TonB-linked outer membrane protein [Mangrovimonas aestuarii]